MTTVNAAEQEDNIRLRKANEFTAYCKDAENALRQQLAEAVQRTKRAREKHEALFSECEQRACARRKAGLIQVNPGY